MLRVTELLLECRRTGREVLDTLSSTDDSSRHWFPDSPTVYRILHLFADVAKRLSDSRPIDLFTTPPPQTVRGRAGCLYRFLRNRRRASRFVTAFHQRHFPELLFGTR